MSKRNKSLYIGGTCVQRPGGFVDGGVLTFKGVPYGTTTAGSRKFTTDWIDRSGNLWLFGGYGDDAGGVQGWLNDLWKFNPSTNQWAWMGGSSTVGTNGGQPGVYGTIVDIDYDADNPRIARIHGGTRHFHEQALRQLMMMYGAAVALWAALFLFGRLRFGRARTQARGVPGT